MTMSVRHFGELSIDAYQRALGRPRAGIFLRSWVLAMLVTMSLGGCGWIYQLLWSGWTSKDLTAESALILAETDPEASKKRVAFHALDEHFAKSLQALRASALDTHALGKDVHNRIRMRGLDVLDALLELATQDGEPGNDAKKALQELSDRLGAAQQ